MSFSGGGRTNYVAIRDMEGLKKALGKFLEFIKIEPDPKNPGLFGFFDNDPDGSGWTHSLYDEDTESDIEFDIEAMICPYLAEDQILVVLESWHDNLIHVSARATAYSTEGGKIELSLSDIYEMAAKRFGKPLVAITTADY